jgi:glycine dehydrogenase subunit 1
LDIVEVPFEAQSGKLSIEALEDIGERLLCAVVGYPNLFGVIESLSGVAETVHRVGGLVISVTAEALALGLVRSPGESGADIAVGEGQSFGIAPQFGGPGVGFMAGRLAHLRQMPGRLVGETRDANGRRAFCLTLATREQHIRRERATSNICTNHSLCALAATAYLSLMGRRGLRELAARNVELAHEASELLGKFGIRRCFNGPFFNEFAVSVPNLAAALQTAERLGVLAGVPLERDYPEMKDGLLISVTEMNTRSDIDTLARALGGNN